MALTNLAVFGGAFFTPILVGKITQYVLLSLYILRFIVHLYHSIVRSLRTSNIGCMKSLLHGNTAQLLKDKTHRVEKMCSTFC